MKIGFSSHPGLVRTNNEDYLVVDQEIGLLLVADGVGGHQGGEVASKLGAETIQREIRRRLQADPQTQVADVIREAVYQAHQAILECAAQDPALVGMGTTVVLGLACQGAFHVAHVGDSRAYLINSQSITPLTGDHSLVSNLIKTGEITEKESRTHVWRHVITQCLGCNEYVGPDIITPACRPGDLVLFCTDGLTDLVRDRRIQKLAWKNRQDLYRGAENLVALANKKGGNDNITIVLAEIPWE
jgi:PPM family protein phosphatase